MRYCELWSEEQFQVGVFSSDNLARTIGHYLLALVLRYFKLDETTFVL